MFPQYFYAMNSYNPSNRSLSMEEVALRGKFRIISVRNKLQSSRIEYIQIVTNLSKELLKITEAKNRY